MLITLSGSNFLPVTVDELKLWARIHNSEEDDLIEVAISAAAEYIENQSQWVLAEKTIEYRADTWCDPIVIPAAPVRDVLAVKYLDEDGALQTVDTADYSWDRTPEGAQVRFARTFTRPVLAEGRTGAVRVQFSAGFDDPAEPQTGDDPDYKLPQRMRMALLFLAARWYENREAIERGQLQEVELAAVSLLAQFRIFR